MLAIKSLQKKTRATQGQSAPAWAISAGVSLALTLGGCGVPYEDPYVYYYYVPDYTDWGYWYFDDDGWWYVDSLPAAAPATTSQTLGPTPGIDDLKELRAQVAAVNASVGNVMRPVAELMKGKPNSAQQGTQEYGPADLPTRKPAATFLLTVKKLQDHKYGWRLAAKPIGADDGRYQVVLTGSLENAIEAHHGTGLAGFNLDNLHAVNPAAYPSTGQLLAATAAAPKGQKALVTRLLNFSPDGMAAPINALNAGDHTADGAYHMRWRMNAERVAAMPDKGPEQVLDYLTWRPDKGGRVYTILSNGTEEHGMPRGDLPANTYLLGESCYSKDSVLLYKAWNSCEGKLPPLCLGTMPVLVETEGKAATDCAAGTESPPPAAALPVLGSTSTAPVRPPALPESIPADFP